MQRCCTQHPHGRNRRTDALMVRIRNDDKLRRFYDHRCADGVAHEQQLLVDFLCASLAGPVVYTGRDMTIVHIGMRLDEEDWKRAIGQALATRGKRLEPCEIGR